ncbi:MAG: hypothetical protein K8I00_04805, partial [Candidatus Omnitrophica bacterium]|nr:hypothetical protein [Candidatus Omnitrophota bacterium]
MQRILLYGFSGFDCFPRNPSQDLVNDLAKTRWKGVRVDKVIFKVSYTRIEKKLAVLFKKEEYDAVIGFGLARNAERIRLEKAARNVHVATVPDVDGCLKKEKRILNGAAEVYQTNVRLIGLRDQLLKEGIPARISHDAGGYLCNFTYYLFLHHFRQSRSRAKCLFIHIPLSSEIACRMEREYP